MEWAPAGLPAGPAPAVPLAKCSREAFPWVRPWGRTTDYAEGMLLQQLPGRSFRSTTHHARTGIGTLRPSGPASG